MSASERKWEEGELMLPGFRFHPTDEELVAFYLRRKVENKQHSIELIKQIDIYKYEPWELPTTSVGIDDQEWYFFCLRGRKYRNSVRPNRVTGSGFWKATGIDKPIYSFKEPHECIGLKKSLVYYRGSAGKGTKTDWMMHEFRLPPQLRNSAEQHSSLTKTNYIALEAEVWTLCRIFKRITTYKKYIPAQPQPKLIFSSSLANSSSKSCTNESDHNNNNNHISSEFYLNFVDHSPCTSIMEQNQHTAQLSSLTSDSLDHHQMRSDPASSAGFWNANDDLCSDWDELRPVVDPYSIDFRSKSANLR